MDDQCSPTGPSSRGTAKPHLSPSVGLRSRALADRRGPEVGTRGPRRLPPGGRGYVRWRYPRVQRVQMRITTPSPAPQVAAKRNTTTTTTARPYPLPSRREGLLRSVGSAEQPSPTPRSVRYWSTARQLCRYGRFPPGSRAGLPHRRSSAVAFRCCPVESAARRADGGRSSHAVRPGSRGFVRAVAPRVVQDHDVSDLGHVGERSVGRPRSMLSISTLPSAVIWPTTAKAYTSVPLVTRIR